LEITLLEIRWSGFQQVDLVNNKFGMMILHASGPSRMKVVVTGPGSTAFTFDEFDSKTGAAWGHSIARGALAAGAVHYQDTPAFGRSPRLVPYSSAGGSPILFDTAGNRLPAREVRQKPDIIAPTGGDTSFWGDSLAGC
jgi:hypothetical protein